MGLLYCIKAHYNCFTYLLVIIFRQNYNLFRLCLMKCRIIAQIRKPPEERSVGERRLVAVTLRMKMNVFLSVSPRILPLDFDFVCSLTLGLYVRRGWTYLYRYFCGASDDAVSVSSHWPGSFQSVIKINSTFSLSLKIRVPFSFNSTA